MEKELDYLEEGLVADTISAMVMLFVGIGVLIMVVILVGVIGGKAHSSTQADLQALVVDANSLPGHAADMNGKMGVEVLADINRSIVNSFSSLSDATGFLGIIILALVFFLVLILLASGMTPFAGGGQRAI